MSFCMSSQDTGGFSSDIWGRLKSNDVLCTYLGHTSYQVNMRGYGPAPINQAVAT